MGILKNFTEKGSTLSKLNGSTPQIPNLKASKLHDEYSLNGTPGLVGKPLPSQLDLNGETPKKYLDNKPE